MRKHLELSTLLPLKMLHYRWERLHLGDGIEHLVVPQDTYIGHNYNEEKKAKFGTQSRC